MAYRVFIFDVVEELVVKTEDEASRIADDEDRLRNRVTKYYEVPDSELDEYYEDTGNYENEK